MDFVFRKSSRSGGGASGTCVEVALNVPDVRTIRDSKNLDGVPLKLSSGTFDRFLLAVKAGRFDW